MRREPKELRKEAEKHVSLITELESGIVITVVAKDKIFDRIMKSQW